MVRSLESPRTVEELLRLPEDAFHRHELIGGRHVVTPSPIPRHQRIALLLSLELVRRIEEPGLGSVYPAPIDVVLSPTDLAVPDIALVLEESRGFVGEKRIEGAPDLVVEITSPSTKRIDLEEKRGLYERAGVREYLVVLPGDDEVLRSVRDGERFAPATRHEREITLGMVEAAPIDLAALWQRVGR